MIKDLDYYLTIDYDIIVEKVEEEDGGGYLAYYKDIPTVMGDGENKKDAISDVKSAFTEYVKICMKYKDPIPEPHKLDEVKRVHFNSTVRRINEVDKRVGKGRRSDLINILINKFLDGEIAVKIPNGKRNNSDGELVAMG